MARKQKNKQKIIPFSRGTIIFFVVVAAVIAGGIYYYIGASIPVNSNSPVFTTPTNIYIKGVHTTDGYVYDEESTRQAKRGLTAGKTDASIHVPKGTLVSLHFINEDKDTGAAMDLNIDEFNVHTGELHYFGAKTINFLADKEGTYSYYSKLHPDMKGTITVDP